MVGSSTSVGSDSGNPVSGVRFGSTAACVSVAPGIAVSSSAVSAGSRLVDLGLGSRPGSSVASDAGLRVNSTAVADAAGPSAVLMAVADLVTDIRVPAISETGVADAVGIEVESAGMGGAVGSDVAASTAGDVNVASTTSLVSAGAGVDVCLSRRSSVGRVVGSLIACVAVASTVAEAVDVEGNRTGLASDVATLGAVGIAVSVSADGAVTAAVIVSGAISLSVAVGAPVETEKCAVPVAVTSRRAVSVAGAVTSLVVTSVGVFPDSVMIRSAG